MRGPNFKDLTGKQYGRLKALKVSGKDNQGKYKWLCKCNCGNTTTVTSSYLQYGSTRSCGCLKQELESKHLRDEYDNKRVDGVAMQLFKDKTPRIDSLTGYRGVSVYFTRVSRQKRYRACITVKGNRYYKGGFKTAEDAYYQGRLKLEQEHLPKERGDRNE